VATRVQKVKVGAFLLINATVILAGLLLVAGYRRGNEMTYMVVFDKSVLGLYTGGLVQYLGVPVGTVDNIYVSNDGKAHVEILVDPEKVTLREGVEASLEYYSFATGTMCIALAGGNPNGKELPEGSIIPVGSSFMESVSSQLAETMPRVTELLDEFAAALEGMEVGAIGDIINNVRDMSDQGKEFLNSANETMNDLRDDVEDGLADFRETAKKMNDLADSAKKLADKANETLESVHAKLEPMDLAAIEAQWRGEFRSLSDRIQETTKTFEETATSLTYGTDNMQHGLLETMQKLNEALDAFRDLAEYLQKDPSALIRGPAREKEPE
jgi:phospholipid/cholesterol/gamma-HCH transport system substrate-binding protein